MIIQDIFSREDRLRHYLGRAYDNKIAVEIDKKTLLRLIPTNYPLDQAFIDSHRKAEIDRLQELNDFTKHYAPSNEVVYLALLRDINIDTKQYVITKAKPSGTNSNVILPFSWYRHTKHIPEVKLHDIPYLKKKSVAVWRGAITGKQKRSKFVSEYFNRSSTNIDVGFTRVPKLHSNKFELLYKERLSIKELLNYKYLISLEGNDTASNFAWIMSSNSILLQPKASTTSWFMQDRLIPWHHFIPLDSSPDDLIKKIEWCENNSTACFKIIENKKRFINQFLDEKDKVSLVAKILDILRNNITYIMNPNNGSYYLNFESIKHKQNIVIKSP